MDTPPIGLENPLGYPAPYGFLVFFKVLGFTLHMVPMHLWYAGLITLLLMRWRGGEDARRLSERVINAMPIVIALGINFGIIPLLFTQVAYDKVFYPATILMAWPWFSVIPMVMLAYYGVYLYVGGSRNRTLTARRRAAGWTAAFLFMAVGFVFANSFSLMTNLEAWNGLLESTSRAGAPLGIGLNLGDPSLWPRWLMTFGLALTTTAAYVMVDTAFFAGRESEAYRRWAGGAALRLHTLGSIWFAATGSWYFFGALDPTIRANQISGAMAVLTALTAFSPGLVWLLILIGRARHTRSLALFIGLAQFAVLALNAVSRQIVQNAELAPALDVTAVPVQTQWSPMVLFLALFVVGLIVVLWMVSQAVSAARGSRPG